MDLKVHVYRLHDDSPVSEELDEECDVSAANHWILPSSQCTNSMHVGICRIEQLHVTSRTRCHP